jgi:hypothetical protein
VAILHLRKSLNRFSRFAANQGWLMRYVSSGFHLIFVFIYSTFSTFPTKTRYRPTFTSQKFVLTNYQGIRKGAFNKMGL